MCKEFHQRRLINRCLRVHTIQTQCPPHTSNTSPSPPTLHNLIGNPIGSPPMTVAPVLQQVAEPINPVVPNGPENQVPNIVPTAPPPSTSPPPAVVNGGSRPSNPNIIGNISAFAFGKPKLPPVSESPILPAVNGSIPETYTPPPPASAYSPPAPAPATYTPPASDYASSPPTSSHTHSPSFSNNQSYNPYTSPTPLTSDVTNQRPPIQHANSAPVLQYEQPQQYVPPTPQHSYTMPPPQHPSASTPRPPVAPQTPQTPSSPGPLSQLSIPKPKINWKQGVSLGLKAAQGLNKLVNVFEGQPANQPDTTGTLLNLAQVGVNAVGGNNNQTQLQAGGTQAGGTQPGGTQAQQMQNPQNLDMNALYNLIANNSQSNSFGGDQSNQGFDASAIYNLIANSGGTSNDQNQVLVQETETVSVFDNGNGMTFVDTTVVDSWQTT
ncbi:hypothetical protein MIND_01296200 [Mycena indigotica]|uniref:Uncharacterized protein n=1 Tax=Mycena indigotica TaxID=2126181 RepID=A0A8H6S1Z4_9AGAR|nr:uncharacterized protein MIND_01296200 [Mycena indigotica]KAF7290561.1 hypothetical protein MIND_01296200 [Mycena indigotica]